MLHDPYFVCTGESLKSLVNYFTYNSHCEFCGDDYKLSFRGSLWLWRFSCLAEFRASWSSCQVCCKCAVGEEIFTLIPVFDKLTSNVLIVQMIHKKPIDLILLLVHKFTNYIKAASVM